MMNYTRVTDLSQIPKGLHWAIVKMVTVVIPGDERSQKHPGHGYPESREEYMTYYVYTDEKSWVEDVERLEKERMNSRGSEYRAMKVSPADVQTTVSVKTKISGE